MVRILRASLIAVGYVVEQLRRIPGVRWVLRHSMALGAVLLLGAVLAFLVWGSQAAPQRASMADLVLGRLSPLQTWIVISGDLSGGQLRNETYRYVLTDIDVPNARMNVISRVELALGPTTISGTYVGGVEPRPVGYTWIGTMRADPVLAPAPGPPWITILLGVVALLIGFAGRFSYPTFFAESPGATAARPRMLAASVRRGTSASAGAVVPATLQLEAGAPVVLRIDGTAEQPLRLYSASASVDVGRLHELSGSEPALRVHQPTGDMDIIFATSDDRDATFAALEADSHYSAVMRPHAATNSRG